MRGAGSGAGLVATGLVGDRVRHGAVAFPRHFRHTPRTMQITTVAWLMCMCRRPRRVEDGVLGA